VRVVGVPFTDVAKDLGAPVVKNVVALGALQGVTQLFPRETFLAAIRAAVGNKSDLAAVNEQAFARGADLACTRT
jgi:Pyruvate/2-oxoacid:ferredoxin oxidoreductase gamma subunit